MPIKRVKNAKEKAERVSKSHVVWMTDGESDALRRCAIAVSRSNSHFIRLAVKAAVKSLDTK